jgi:hypothetical protein
MDEQKEWQLFYVRPMWHGLNGEHGVVKKGAPVYTDLEHAVSERSRNANRARKKNSRHRRGRIYTRWVPTSFFRWKYAEVEGILVTDLNGWKMLTENEVNLMLLENEVEESLQEPLFSQYGTVSGRLSSSKPNLSFARSSDVVRMINSTTNVDFTALEMRILSDGRQEG